MSSNVALCVAFGVMLLGADSELQGGESLRLPAPSPLDGAYRGVEPMPGFGAPGERWYHVMRLTIDGETVTLKAVPFCDRDGKTWSSSSDGGFWIYTGTLTRQANAPVAAMTLQDSSYVRIRDIHPSWKMETLKDGSLKMNGIVNKRRRDGEGVKSH